MIRIVRNYVENSWILILLPVPCKNTSIRFSDFENSCVSRIICITCQHCIFIIIRIKTLGKNIKNRRLVFLNESKTRRTYTNVDMG